MTKAASKHKEINGLDVEGFFSEYMSLKYCSCSQEIEKHSRRISFQVKISDDTILRKALEDN